MQTDSNSIYSLALSYVTAKAVALAAEYQLDQRLANGSVTVGDLAHDLSVNEHALLRLLRVLEAYDVVTLHKDRVGQTELTQQLADVRSPHLLAAYKAFDELEYSLQTQEAAWDKVYGQDFYTSLTGQQQQQFALWCQRSAYAWIQGVVSHYDFSCYQNIIDIGGGQGQLLSLILQLNPDLNGVLFDRPEVIDQVDPSINTSDRMQVVGGDFFTAVPGEGDLYIISRTLLNFSDAAAVRILNVCAQHMPKTAKLLVLDFVLPDKQHPHYRRTVLSDLNLLVCMNSCNRSEQEWRNLLDKSRLTCEQVQVSDHWQPEPFAPIILLECSNSHTAA